MKFYKAMSIVGIICSIICIIVSILLGKNNAVIGFSFGLICFLIPFGIILYIEKEESND